MHTLEMNPDVVLLALAGFDNILSPRELIIKEQAIVHRIDAAGPSENCAIKYAYTVLRTHILFIEEKGDELDIREEVARIRQTVNNILQGRVSLGAAVLEILGPRHPRMFAQIFPDGYYRVGVGTTMEIQNEDED